MTARALLAVSLLAAAVSAAAQQLYRWTDEKGRVNITDTPPPASAKDVQVRRGSGNEGASEPQQPYELTLAMKDFPVTLYTSPNCKDPCVSARTVLNRRGVPFQEVEVNDQASLEELKRVSGGDDVPTLVVGRSVHRGFVHDAYDALLDAARYPKAKPGS